MATLPSCIGRHAQSPPKSNLNPIAALLLASLAAQTVLLFLISRLGPVPSFFVHPASYLPFFSLYSLVVYEPFFFCSSSLAASFPFPSSRWEATDLSNLAPVHRPNTFFNVVRSCAPSPIIRSNDTSINSPVCLAFSPASTRRGMLVSRRRTLSTTCRAPCPQSQSGMMPTHDHM